jgi:hypothetical protein
MRAQLLVGDGRTDGRMGRETDMKKANSRFSQFHEGA